MNKFKNYISNNKKKIIIIFIVLIAFVLLFVFLFAVIKYLMPDTKESVYGDRCKITEEYPVDDERESKLQKFLEDYEKMDFVSIEVKCNLIDVIVEVDDKVSFSKVKSMGKKMLSQFSEDELKYYDIQLMIRSNNSESEDYPKVGTHHKEINGSANSDFIW